mgnify:FL=1
METKSPERVKVILPARLASTRLPRKLLLRHNGKSLLQIVYEKAASLEPLWETWAAVDSEELLQEVEGFGGRALLTPESLDSGSARVSWAAERLGGDILVNLQADEPMILAQDVARALSALRENPSASASTLAFHNNDYSDFLSPNNVKVVVDSSGRGCYFSRSPIPYQTRESFQGFLHHVGVYVYRREFLLKTFPSLRSSWERGERLEQLRLLENGYTLVVETASRPTLGIDTAEDWEKFKALSGGENG